MLRIKKVKFTNFRYFSLNNKNNLNNLNNLNSVNIIKECEEQRKSVQQLSDLFKGPLLHSALRNTVLPFVFLLGNHSSGKSSFVNYLLQRKVQAAGVAPTDDCFTVIAPGPEDADRDGPSFIGDPDMGFNALKNFGPNLVHHTVLKIRSSTVVKDFMIVDTPGMIDSPRRQINDANFNQIPANLSNNSINSLYDQHLAHQKHLMKVERGYDFEEVCRWYAERADVILLFFDPGKAEIDIHCQLNLLLLVFM
jgi:hypothetical protein